MGYFCLDTTYFTCYNLLALPFPTRGIHVKKILFVAVCLFSVPAFADLAAGTPVVTWTNPTQNEDGTTIPVPPSTAGTALKETRLYLDGATTPVKTVAQPATTYTFVFGEIMKGTHTLTATAVNIDLQESVKSNQITFTCLNCKAQKPKAPALQNAQ